MSAQFPSLKIVRGSLNMNGNRNISEKDFPILERVGGDIHLGCSGFKCLPSRLNKVDGHIFLSLDLPKTLIDDCKSKKVIGIVKGQIYLVGGSVTNKPDGSVSYEEIMPLTI